MLEVGVGRGLEAGFDTGWLLYCKFCWTVDGVGDCATFPGLYALVVWPFDGYVAGLRVLATLLCIGSWSCSLHYIRPWLRRNGRIRSER